MIARRSSPLSRDQRAISSIVRRQPVHSFSVGWITQILMQGLSISFRFQISVSYTHLTLPTILLV